MDMEQARQRLDDERRRLDELRQQAVATLADERESDAGELSSLDQHPADMGTEVHDREVNESVLQGFDTQIAEIDAALDRVDDGTYGRCEECREPIPDDRLEVVPAARFCAQHQPSGQAVR